MSKELEGALNKVAYHAKFSRKGLSIAIAKESFNGYYYDWNRVSVD